MKKILLVEDDLHLGRTLKLMIEMKEQYRVDWEKNGWEAYACLQKNTYDIIILDWMLPKMSGLELCRRLRSEGYSGAILMLTAKDAVDDRIEGLDSGCDDYLVKPFATDELLARVRALLRRAERAIVPERMQIGSWIVDFTHQTVKKDDAILQLTPREFQLFVFLFRHHGQTLSRQLLLDYIWGYEADVTEKAVDAMIKLLRKNLAAIGAASIIESIRGVGYRLNVENMEKENDFF